MLMNKNKKILYLVGQENISNKPLTPFNDMVCDFLSDLSQKLNSDKTIKNYPDIKTFAFWCR